MTEPPLSLSQKGEAALTHYGVKGMKWGVRRESSTTSSSPLANLKMPLTTAQKRIVVTTVGTGAAVATTLLAGPVGGMAISAVTRAADITISAKDKILDERR